MSLKKARDRLDDVRVDNDPMEFVVLVRSLNVLMFHGNLIYHIH